MKIFGQTSGGQFLGGVDGQISPVSVFKKIRREVGISGGPLLQNYVRSLRVTGKFCRKPGVFIAIANREKKWKQYPENFPPNVRGLLLTAAVYPYYHLRQRFFILVKSLPKRYNHESVKGK
ncbi:hypothetical protein CHISP_3001 [Chitinispirillum alkaliphilum]|nr:hypothetical protein CHISP_3001 [Chitinispirillum alkaliphilum]